MSNLKRLVKLRQYRDGMDIGKYLTTELRQNWLAIEDALRRAGIIQTTNQIITQSVSNGLTVFSSSSSSGFIAGVIPISSYDSVVVDGGVLSANVYYPKVSGRYFVQWGYVYETDFTPTAKLANVLLKNSLAVTIASLISYDQTQAGINHKIVLNPFKGVVVDLSPTIGIYFDSTIDPGITCSGFSCSVIKIADI